MNLLLVLNATFGQVRDMLIKMDEKRYQQSLDIFSQSSIGQHCRHTIEFMQCLIAQYPEGRINYDKRIRNDYRFYRWRTCR